MQGTPITATGSDNCDSPHFLLDVLVYTSASGCTVSVGSFAGTYTAPGSPPNAIAYSLPTSSLSPGSYCLDLTDGTNHATPLPTFAVTSATTIPEYPIGLSVLAVFMILAYGVIRRKTITKQK
jgi:hypothetical protein